MTTRPHLTLQAVTLLHPEQIVAQRVTDADSFAAVVKSASDAVIAYDKANVDALPDEIDLIVVIRPGGVRCYIVSDKGDVAIRELDDTLAKLPSVPVRDGSVAAVQTLARGELTERDPYFPTAWKDVAAPGGSSIDDVISAAWPLPS
jgi:hypothetical protein